MFNRDWHPKIHKREYSQILYNVTDDDGTEHQKLKYSTYHSVLIATYLMDTNYGHEFQGLYRTLSGRHFILTISQKGKDFRIRPMTRESAMSWALGYLSMDCYTSITEEFFDGPCEVA